VLSFVANIETKWMKAEIKQEAKELHKMRTEVDALLKKENHEKTTADRPGSAGSGGL
jgi:Skp family chaperone for outer membrane proteins